MSSSAARGGGQSAFSGSFFQVEHGQGPFGLQRLDADLRGDILRDGAERLCLSAVRLADDDGDSQVAAFANADRDRDRSEERRAVSFGQRLAPAIAEDEELLSVIWALETAHVLDNAEDRHAQLIEHAVSLAH